MDESLQKHYEQVKNYIDFINKSNKTKDVFYSFMSVFKKDITNKDIEDTILFQALDLLLSDNKSDFCRILKKGDIFYRARIIDNDILEYAKDYGLHSSSEGFLSGFNEANSKEPPISVSPAGRNNYMGASYLYLSETPITAVAEVNPQSLDLISVAKFRINKQIKVVDFSNNASIKKLNEFEIKHGISASILITLVMQQYGTPVSKPEEYAATQYISDLIRKMGYDGIIYKSSKTEDANLTVFTCHKKYISYVNSTIMLFQANVPIMYDLNTNEKFSTKIDDIDKIAIDKLKRDLYLIIK